MCACAQIVCFLFLFIFIFSVFPFDNKSRLPKSCPTSSIVLSPRHVSSPSQFFSPHFHFHIHFFACFFRVSRFYYLHMQICISMDMVPNFKASWFGQGALNDLVFSVWTPCLGQGAHNDQTRVHIRSIQCILQGCG